MPFTEQPPKPPEPPIVRFIDGKPTGAQLEYELKFYAWLRRLMASIP